MVWVFTFNRYKVIFDSGVSSYIGGFSETIVDNWTVHTLRHFNSYFHLWIIINIDKTASVVSCDIYQKSNSHTMFGFEIKFYANEACILHLYWSFFITINMNISHQLLHNWAVYFIVYSSRCCCWKFRYKEWISPRTSES